MWSRKSAKRAAKEELVIRFEETVLDNGLQLVAETNSDARSAAIGFFVRTGSRDETPTESGVSHFLEHMVFKGSERRTALDVNREFDEIGAKYNAYTSEENTVFWGAVLPEYLPRLAAMLADLLRPSLRSEDFDVEKNVILEEIGMYDDSPSFKVYEKMMRVHFGLHPLGNSVLGTKESVGALSQDQMLDYFSRRYRPGNVVAAASGNVDWSAFRQWISEYCGSWPAGTPERTATTPHYAPQFEALHDPKLNQQHILIMSPAPAAESADRFAAETVAAVVGDDTGSRLYWDLVDPGHADSASMDFHEYQGAGAFLTYVSCEPDSTADNVRRVLDIFRDVLANGIRDDELDQVKNKGAARIVLRSERPMGRLTPVAFNWIYRREYRTIDDDLQTVQAVTPAHIRRVVALHPLDRVTVVTLGPLGASELTPASCGIA